MAEQFTEYVVAGLEDDQRLQSIKIYSSVEEAKEWIPYHIEAMKWKNVHVEKRTVKVGDWRRVK